MDSMSLEEREEFNCDVRIINWRIYIENIIKGLQIYVFGQDTVMASHEM